MRTADFHFELPPELIAQHPAAKRDQARLLVLHRLEKRVEHRQFRDVLDYFQPGDVLVLNNSRVIRARLRGVNVKTGGAFELLLLEENAPNDWWAMIKPGKRARVGTQIQIGNRKSEIGNIQATVTATNAEGHRRLQFSGTANILSDLGTLGEIPLPPYIRRNAGTPAATTNSDAERRSPDRLESENRPLQQADREIGAPSDEDRYQTVFAEPPGSVAAPTAGLHFTPELLQQLRSRGVEIHFVTLHVGLGTFAPVKAQTLADHVMHEERYEVSETVANAVNAAKASNRRVIAVGTTSVRVLESALESAGAPASGPARWKVQSGPGRTRIFIHPPYEFKIVDALLTNFHLPCSTLLMLVSAFASPEQLSGRETILNAYTEAIRERYRFFSYGDAMLIV
ncbi:MAG TPA: S-adenosylmethionine:tRNA ribosyltransferase-isomerase [Verrucomicrobiae bacterium]|nr:S-adenosylmethionine:tRNA ribosyltransferase-isomerase [Verrucomicrobiae bacterium]